MNEIELDARAASSTGLDPQFAAALAYLAGPLSGIVILLAERTNRFVRFHAWQALIGLGALALLAVALLLAAFLGIFVSPVAFTTLSMASAVAAVVWLITWLLCIWKAITGSAFRLPLVSSIAERRARL